MRTWFHQNYQDPVHECPYDGREGGYQYIHGGPYEASEELYDEFGGVIDDEIIQELADDLEAECSEWSGISKPEDYDDYLFDIVGTIEKPYEELMASIENLKSMLSIGLSGNQEQTMLKMVFTNTITVLEAYLSEYFIGRVESEPHSLRKFVESNKDFKQKKISLSEIFNEKDNIENYTKEYLVDLLWHNIPKIKVLFQNTLGVDFPDNSENLIKATHLRHDLVHRAGKTKEGQVINLTQEDVTSLIDEVVKLASHIEEKGKPNF